MSRVGPRACAPLNERVNERVDERVDENPGKEPCPDGDTPAQPGADDHEPDWVDRHLVKILVAVGVVCCIGLVGRAMTG